MIPKIIHQIWIGDQSKRPIELMKGVKDMHPDWKYKLWTEKEIMQNGIIRQTMFREIVAKTTKPDALAKIADIARYIILEQYGGFYLDADTEMLKPLDDLLDNTFVTCFEIDNVLLQNGIIGSEPRYPILTFCSAAIGNLWSCQGDILMERRAWKTTGPVLLTAAVNFHQFLKPTVLSHKAFVPINHSDFDTLEEYEELKSKLTDESYCTTIWNSKTIGLRKSNREKFVTHLTKKMRWLQNVI